MRHQKSGRKFGRKSASRDALFSNMIASLIEHEQIRTTEPKAKELKKLADRTISWAASVGHLLGESAKADSADKVRIVHAMRMASRSFKNRDIEKPGEEQKNVLSKLFHVVGPRMAGRAGGYTRVLKVGHRHGDAAPMSIIELVDRKLPERAPAPDAKAAK